MRQKLSREVRQEYTTKLIFMLFFLFLLGAFLWWQRDNSYQLAPFDLILLTLATLRLGRLIAFDVVAEPVRLPFTRTVPDETGAGDTVEARGTGARRAIGQLISCPICAGTWVSAVLVYGLYAFPQPTRVFLALTATIGLAEILNAVIETLCWSADLSRSRVGSNKLARKEKSTLLRAIPSQGCEEEETDQNQFPKKDVFKSP